MINDRHTHALRQGNAPPDLSRATLAWFRQGCGIITLPAEMVLYPFFGSRYFTPMVAIFGFVAAYLVIFFPGPFAIHRDIFTNVPEYFLKGFCVLYFVHFVRIARRMAKPITEADSEWEGPPLPIFTMLPYGHSWTIRRVFYEPAAVFAFAVFMAFTVIAPIFNNYILIIAITLFLKAAITWYESWTSLRDFLDKSNRAEILQSLSHDLSATSVGRFPLSPLADAPASERSGLVATVARIDD